HNGSCNPLPLHSLRQIPWNTDLTAKFLLRGGVVPSDSVWYFARIHGSHKERLCGKDYFGRIKVWPDGKQNDYLPCEGMGQSSWLAASLQAVVRLQLPRIIRGRIWFLTSTAKQRLSIPSLSTLGELREVPAPALLGGFQTMVPAPLPSMMEAGGPFH